MIRTFVFFDLETTGLPKAERNRTKITELSFVAVSRYDIFDAKYGVIPACQKLTLLFNPQRQVSAVAMRMTGLSREYLKNCSTFGNKVETILSFLNDLDKPVCLVAHNGNPFDFKILLSEFVSIGRTLPSDLLCVDSLMGFRKILKDNPIDYKSLNPSGDDGVLTDDEDEEFPVLNISNEDWREVDMLSTALSDVFIGDVKADGSKNLGPYALSTLYKRLLNKEITNAHRAEGDCIMLLECVVALKKQFILWADATCKKIDTVKPFVPY